MVAIIDYVSHLMEDAAHALYPSGASGGEFAARRNPVELPVELHQHIMHHVETGHLARTLTVSKGWGSDARSIIKSRRKEIQPLIDKIDLLGNIHVGDQGPGSPRLSAALSVVRAMREHYDALTRTERTKLVSFATGLKDWDFHRALDAFGPGVRHFSVADQNSLLGRAEGILRRAPYGNDNLVRATMRLVPYLSKEPRQRAFKLFLGQARPAWLRDALRAVAERSVLMSKSELDDAVKTITPPPEKSFLEKIVDPAPRPDPLESYRPDLVEILGRGKGLSSEHRDSLLAIARTFTKPADFSRALAGILDGAALSPRPRWPGPEGLKDLTNQVLANQFLDGRFEQADRARVMAAICRAADEYAPDGAVRSLKYLTTFPRNEAIYGLLFKNLSTQMPPTVRMLDGDREYLIDRLLKFNPLDQKVARDRTYAIVNAVGHVDYSSPAPIDERLFHAAVTLPDEDYSALAISNAARRIAEQMRGAEPAAHAILATRASDLVDRALDLGSDAFYESLLGLRAVLPGISDQQKKNLVAHVLALPEDDPNRLPTNRLLLQSHAVLGPGPTKDLLDRIGI